MKLFDTVSKRKIILFLLLMIILTLNTFMVANMEEIAGEKGYGLTVFYYMQMPGIYLWYYLILCFAIPNVSCAENLQNKRTHYHYFQIIRQGYKKYCHRSFIRNFIKTSSAVMIIQVYLLFLIHFCISSINFSAADPSDVYIGLSSNLLVNLICYIIASSIGFGVFSNLLFALQCFIKNIYLFRALGLFLALFLFLLPAYLSRIAVMIFDSQILSFIFGMFFLPNLILPSIENINVYALSPVPAYLLGSCIYGIISIYLYKYKCQKEHRYE